MAAGLTEPAARAELAAGRALPLAWLWLLAGAELTVTNPQESGRTLKLKVEDGQSAHSVREEKRRQS